MQLAVTKTAESEWPPSNEENPFLSCITCRRPFFAQQSHAKSALVKASYDIHQNDPIDSYWHQNSTIMMASLYVDERNFVEANKLLNRTISQLRSQVHVTDFPRRFRLFLSDTLRELARLHKETGSLDQMKSCLEEAVSLAEKTGTSDIGFKLSLGKHAFLIGDFTMALEYFEYCIRATKDRHGRTDKCMFSIFP